METLELKSPVIREPRLALTVVVLLLATALLQLQSQTMALLFVIAIVMGLTLFQSSFSFSAAYRNLFLKRDTEGVRSHLLLLGITSCLFAPFLYGDAASGLSLAGALAPVGIGMAFGAFLFGVGMQLGGACASGTLYTVGSGNPRSVIVLVFFCAGAFWGSLDIGWWQRLPGVGVISLPDIFGWKASLAGQVFLLVGLYVLMMRLHKPANAVSFQKRETLVRQALRGPWPLVAAVFLLAILNLSTLITVGHPWTITWGFTLWAAKLAELVGWNPATSAFWAAGFPRQALLSPVWMDVTSVMNAGILGGAFLGVWASRRKLQPKTDRRLGPVIAAIIGGFMLGYGARLAYGCNIGAFISGAASGSLHGWVWIVCALPGNWIGMHLRKYFGLQN